MLKIRNLIVFSLVFIFCATPVLAQTDSEVEDELGREITTSDIFAQIKDEYYLKAEVLSVEEEEVLIGPGSAYYNSYSDEDQYQVNQEVVVKLVEGDQAGKEVDIYNEVADNPTHMRLKVGEKVMLYITEFTDGNKRYFVSAYVRNYWLYAFFAIFFIALLALSVKNGLRAISGLLFTIVVVFFVVIPLVLKGYNPFMLAILAAMVISVCSLLIVGGFTKKSLGAIMGTVGGVFVAGLLAIIMSNLIKLGGVYSEDTRILFSQRPDLDFQSLLFGAILLGSLGAVMDVGMSISTTITEIQEKNKSATFKDLYKSGMVVGKDIIGTMSNTLILAYIGSALPLVLFFVNLDAEFSQIINFDFIGAEVVRSLAGSIGLIFAIPITAFFTSYLKTKKS